MQDLDRDVVAGREVAAEQERLVAVLEDDAARGGRPPRGRRQPQAGERYVRDAHPADPSRTEQDVGIPGGRGRRTQEQAGRPGAQQRPQQGAWPVLQEHAAEGDAAHLSQPPLHARQGGDRHRAMPP